MKLFTSLSTKYFQKSIWKQTSQQCKYPYKIKNGQELEQQAALIPPSQSTNADNGIYGKNEIQLKKTCLPKDNTFNNTQFRFPYILIRINWNYYNKNSLCPPLPHGKIWKNCEKRLGSGVTLNSFYVLFI